MESKTKLSQTLDLDSKKADRETVSSGFQQGIFPGTFPAGTSLDDVRWQSIRRFVSVRAVVVDFRGLMRRT